ncbi:MAG: hypothetical protein ABGZ17_22300, partial [Planctomycetaceae bacterium]
MELRVGVVGASLAVDRIHSCLSLPRADQPAGVLETIEDSGFGNRFSRHVFPALRAHTAGQSLDHPDLKDGRRVQRFTDAAARSAKPVRGSQWPPSERNQLTNSTSCGWPSRPDSTAACTVAAMAR